MDKLDKKENTSYGGENAPEFRTVKQIVRTARLYGSPSVSACKGPKLKKTKVASGAKGCSTGIAQYKLTLKMAKKLEKELKSRGYKVKMIRRKNDVNISNSRRAKIANKAKADAFIRIHANGASDPSFSGALTIAPAKNRGVLYTNTMSGINWSKVPVTIVEMGFLSNKKEDKKKNQSSSYQKMSRGMADGIDRYFKRAQ